jgi:predicted transcriptional regulator
MTRKARWGAFGVVVFMCLVAAGVAVAQVRTGSRGLQTAAVDPSCQLNSAKGNIKHVIYIQFDNTHFRRDNANVPSDLEQMPNLLDFITGNGTLLSNDHTILISHTAGGILSSLTGVYPDRHGQIVSNSNVRYNGAGFQFPSSFGYWTDPVTANTTVPNMVTPTGQNAPAPWVPYTRAGCDFGAVATANTVLENTGTGPSGDITKVFGNPSPQATEATNNRVQAQADFVGFAIHCAQGSATCANGQDDLLPDEPGGYTNFKGLFGAQEIAPVINGGPLTDLDGKVITDSSGHAGFPGFDGMFASTSLSWVAKMQEAGVPVTFAYISDAHDFHGTAGEVHTAFGPGSPGYVQQLRSYNDAFGKFFADLAAHGIDKSNTLFVFTVDEGDHFVGVQKTNCDGVNVPCNYGPNEVGEITANVDTLMQHQHPEIPINWTVHGDDAPTVYVSGNPDPSTAPVRSLERAWASLTAVNPYTGNRDPLMAAMADRAEMKALHMFTTGDPLRDPSFAFFGDPNYFLTDFPTSTCETCINPAFAWNHGDIQPEIANTWLGFVGPGVKNEGVNGTLWSDHTDVRPTMLSVLGLNDDYVRDGRPVTQVLDSGVVPATLQSSDAVALGDMLKRLDAPFGEFGMNTLKASSVALASDTTHDNRYTTIEKSIASVTDQRNQVVDAIKAQLAGAEVGTAIDHATASDLLDRAQGLLGRAAGLGH